MITGLQEWAASERLIQTSPLHQLHGRCLAIDAEHHIKQILSAEGTKEPLITALGGVPFALESHLTSHVKQLQDSGIKPVFVFNGLSTYDESQIQARTLDAVKKIDRAWDLYNAGDAGPAVATFGAAREFDLESSYRAVQALLHKLKVPFLVAPYNVSAQMAFMERDAADAIYGSSDLLLFECQRVILSLDLEEKSFTWITRRSCIDTLAYGNVNLWLDAALLAGSDMLPLFPLLEIEMSPSARPPKIKAAAQLLQRNSTTGHDLVIQYAEDPMAKDPMYYEAYRKAYMLTQYHVVISFEGEMITLNKQSTPGDLHAILGQRLPEEIYHYVSRGVIGTRVLTARALGRVVAKMPLDGGDNGTYRELIKTQNVPQQAKSLALLSQSLHRFYQHNDVALVLPFGPEDQRSTDMGTKDLSSVKSEISDWHVTSDKLSSKGTGENLYSAITSLKDSSFAGSTITPKKGSQPLKSVSEIKSNAIWRYLHLHGYVSKNHTLTPLGQALETAYTTASAAGLDPTDFSEPLLLGIELLRHNLLSSDKLFPSPQYTGGPQRGSAQDQSRTLLLSRIACLAQLQHKPIGFTGPLSRTLLAYKSVIGVLRASQRDMLDMSLVTMLLDGDVDRGVPDAQLRDVGFGLPFLHDVDCALGLLVKHYLDEVAGLMTDQGAAAATPDVRDGIKHKARSQWFPHAVDPVKSLDLAFGLWDALYKAVKTAPENVFGLGKKGATEWDAVDQWLAGRR